MRRPATPALILLCGIALGLACFGQAFLRDEQFGYRDAAHFYYPLYQRVQREWDAGRWPLWEPEENAGMPLLGNPTAAVLYPGKIIYATLPYATAAKVYIVAHTALAFLGAYLMLRGWKSSRESSAIAGFSYAFGAPVLFQYCNIIYLVGAAWLPFGLMAVDRWLRLKSRWALLGLAIVLAMETLGGDPEMAYLTGLCALGYAYLLTRPQRQEGRRRSFTNLLLVVVVMSIWIMATLAMAQLAPMVREAVPQNQPPVPLWWMKYVGPAVGLAWFLVGAVLIRSWRNARRRARPDEPSQLAFVPMLFGLFGSALLAGALTAAQLLPVVEFTGLSGRAAADGPHEIYTFSLEPHRVVEFLWPNLFGTPFEGNRSWLHLIGMTNKSVKTWVPSLYFGVITLILGLGAFRLSRGNDKAPWRSWISHVAILCLLASFGEFTSPIYWARFSPEMAKVVGPHDEDKDMTIRKDRRLRDGDGSVYWALATFLPGFRQFRFPCKLLTLTVLAMSVLAGQGWDALTAGDRAIRRRTIAWAFIFLALTAAVLAGTIVKDSLIAGFLKAHDRGSSFGPLDAAGALAEMRWGLVQGGLLMALTVALARLALSRPRTAGAIALLAVCADLGVANARYVLTVPQSLFEGTPEAIRLIDADEKAAPFGGPFRVHRMPMWNPLGWTETASKDRVRDFVEWERRTIQPKYGINEGVQYTSTLGVAELYDYEWFFGGFRRALDAEGAQALNRKVGDEVVVVPRRAYDFWNTRYFVIPSYPGDWTDEYRGYASLLEKTEQIYPPTDWFNGADKDKKLRDFIATTDFQIRKNLACYPRAWVVHQARFLPSTNNMSRDGRNAPMQEILYSAEPFWREAARTLYDPLTLAWLESETQGELRESLSNLAPSPNESVRVTSYESDRVELEATLKSPGMVILSDVFYPGWTLTIGGKPAPIYRANRMMRGAAVPSGTHKLVYVYDPRSFRVGLWISVAGLVVLAGSSVVLMVRARRT